MSGGERGVCVVRAARDVRKGNGMFSRSVRLGKMKERQAGVRTGEVFSADTCNYQPSNQKHIVAKASTTADRDARHAARPLY
ncbi:hypothetical protein E2C01_041980 [Portunus trituberculatus]|uniref:Uncharacterized protein n=1 Tax=Portunus trituberculatus TaxID=210409 RepID=A0A5B7FNY6_PORTR|nr:hypothetical protein [Portunus trituberculatus]